jgi:hypothetical protein
MNARLVIGVILGLGLAASGWALDLEQLRKAIEPQPQHPAPQADQHADQNAEQPACPDADRVQAERVAPALLQPWQERRTDGVGAVLVENLAFEEVGRKLAQLDQRLGRVVHALVGVRDQPPVRRREGFHLLPAHAGLNVEGYDQQRNHDQEPEETAEPDLADLMERTFHV